jgi:hypothetical protein
VALEVLFQKGVIKNLESTLQGKIQRNKCIDVNGLTKRDKFLTVTLIVETENHVKELPISFQDMAMDMLKEIKDENL